MGVRPSGLLRSLSLAALNLMTANANNQQEQTSMNKQARKQFNICERINKARALVESVYADTGDELAEAALESLSTLFDRQFAAMKEIQG